MHSVASTTALRLRCGEEEYSIFSRFVYAGRGRGVLKPFATQGASRWAERTRGGGMVWADQHLPTMSNEMTEVEPRSTSISQSLWPTKPLPPVTTHRPGTGCSIAKSDFWDFKDLVSCELTSFRVCIC